MLISDIEATKKRVKELISLIPLHIHLIDFTTKEFVSMLKTTELNVGKETQNNIILFGIEDYCRLVSHA